MNQQCPFHTAIVRSPCQIRTCDLWIATPDFYHCGWIAYDHLTQTSSDGVGWLELGKLLQLTDETVKDLVQRALDHVRLAKLKERVAPCQQWSLLKGSKHCVVCRKTATLFKDGWGWCSKACYQWSPPALLEVEEKLGVHLHEALQKRYVNPKFLARVTGLDKTTLQWLIWQRLGLADGSREWRKQLTPLVPNPGLPSAAELRQRIKRARRWA